jgi:hypothetical protein
VTIEYKIRFEADGVTITQRVEPDGATAPLKNTGSGDQGGITTLGNSQSESRAAAAGAGGNSSQAGGSAGSPPITGGGGPALRPLSAETPPDTGGGGPGLGGAQVVILGPLVIGAPAPRAKGAAAGD